MSQPTSTNTRVGTASRAAHGPGSGDVVLQRILPALVVALVAIRLVAVPFQEGSDEDIFRYVGYAWARTTDLPCRGAFDENKPPGIFLLWALVWRVVDGSAVVARIMGLAATCVSGLLLARLGVSLWGPRWGRVGDGSLSPGCFAAVALGSLGSAGTLPSTGGGSLARGLWQVLLGDLLTERSQLRGRAGPWTVYEFGQERRQELPRSAE